MKLRRGAREEEREGERGEGTQRTRRRMERKQEENNKLKKEERRMKREGREKTREGHSNKEEGKEKDGDRRIEEEWAKKTGKNKDGKQRKKTKRPEPKPKTHPQRRNRREEGKENTRPTHKWTRKKGGIGNGGTHRKEANHIRGPQDKTQQKNKTGYKTRERRTAMKLLMNIRMRAVGKEKRIRKEVGIGAQPAEIRTQGKMGEGGEKERGGREEPRKKERLGEDKEKDIGERQKSAEGKRIDDRRKEVRRRRGQMQPRQGGEDEKVQGSHQLGCKNGQGRRNIDPEEEIGQGEIQQRRTTRPDNLQENEAMALKEEE